MSSPRLCGHVQRLALATLGSPPPYVGSLPYVRDLDDPIDTAVFAAIIAHYRKAPPSMISFSNGIGDAVAPLGISYEQVLESIEILVSQHLVSAQKLLGPRYQLNGIPDHLWLEEEARSGLDIDNLLRQMLSDIVNKPKAPARPTGTNTTAPTGEQSARSSNEFERAMDITVHFPQGGSFVQNVTALAKRALQEMG